MSLFIKFVTFDTFTNMLSKPIIPNDEEMEKFKRSVGRTHVNYAEVLDGFAELVSLGLIPQNEIGNFKAQAPCETKVIERKRSGVTWTQEEVDAIEDGIQKFGVGKWTKIYELHKDIFMKRDRRAGDISDKWKNLKNKPKFQKYIQQPTPPAIPSAPSPIPAIPPNVVAITPQVNILSSTKQSSNTPIPQPKVIIPQLLEAAANIAPGYIVPPNQDQPQ